METIELKNPMWFHPVYDGNDWTAYLIDWYFFDKAGKLIAHAIREDESHIITDIDEIIVDYEADGEVDLYSHPEDAIPEKLKKQVERRRVLESLKADIDLWEVHDLLDSYNERAGHTYTIISKHQIDRQDMMNSLKRIIAYLKQ